MSFCRARQWPQGSGPSGHEAELSRDNPHKRPKLFPYQQKHAGATGQGCEGTRWAGSRCVICLGSPADRGDVPRAGRAFADNDSSDVIQARSISFSQHKLNQVARRVFGVPFLSYLMRIAVRLTSG